MTFALSVFSPHVCPSCFSTNTRRSHREGTSEFLLHWLFLVSPYRCRDCQERYFGYRFAQPPVHPVASRPH